MKLNRALIIGVFLLLPSAWVAADSKNPAVAEVRYEVEFTDPAHHFLNVKVYIPQGKQRLQVQLPAWRTGHYRILNLANGISHFKASSLRGTKLVINKTDKSTWWIENPTKKNVVLSYEVYANELGSRTRSLTPNHFYFDASAVFVYATSLRKNPVKVELNLPKGWLAVSGMHSPKEGVFQAINYDVLVDSPIEGGEIFLHDFSGEKKYRISGWGTELYDFQKIEKDILKIESAAKSLWGDFPFDDYLVILHSAPGIGGATEHLNSTVMQSPAINLEKREDYLRFIGTFSHEFVHTWNVKAYRAAAIAPYNYQTENYTNLLWLEEGATSYFDGLLNFRAGVTNQKEFLAELAKVVNRYLAKPGVLHRSVSEASFDWWAKQAGEFDYNRSVSIYDEGMIASWVLDFWMREQSKQKASFDTLHRELYQRYKLPHDKLPSAKGFTENQLKSLMSELSGHSADAIWQQVLHSAERMDIASLLNQAGLALTSSKEAAKFNPEWKLKISESGAQVVRVSESGPAWQAGIAAGDKLVAIDNRVVTQSLIDSLAKGQFEKSVVTVHYLRSGRLFKTELKTSGNRFPQKLIKPMKEPTKQQLAFFKAWTGHELELKSNEKSVAKDKSDT